MNWYICIFLLLVANIQSFSILTADKTGNVTSAELNNIYKTIGEAENTYP